MNTIASPALDTRCALETPDGVELVLVPAGPVLRGVAWGIDAAIRGGLLVGLATVLGLLEAVGMAIMLLAWFLINWWYPVLFEVLSQGSTPGKKAVGLRVVMQDGLPVGWSASIVRNLLRQVDFLPALYATGLVAMLCNRRFQRLGDLAAATMVVYHGQQTGPGLNLPPGESERPPVPLSPSEQRILLAFAERSRALNPERAAELANLLEPVSGETGPEGVEQALRWARALRGENG
ncbi:MAG: RDD family protein [Wenzhouxiangella sp.]